MTNTTAYKCRRNVWRPRPCDLAWFSDPPISSESKNVLETKMDWDKIFIFSFKCNIARISNDCFICKYLGTNISTDYLMCKYLWYRVHVLCALTVHIPVNSYWRWKLIHSRGKAAHLFQTQACTGIKYFTGNILFSGYWLALFMTRSRFFLHFLTIVQELFHTWYTI